MDIKLRFINQALDGNKSGRMADAKTAVTPGQTASFHYQPGLWIGVACQITQGMRSARTS